MGDRLRGHEKPAYKAENYHSAESVLDRLNQIDLRLRQLEKKERLTGSCFAGDLGGRRYQLPSDMVDARLKEALMDRLNLLETRIRQLSEELDNGGSSSGGRGHSMMAITFPAEKQKQIQRSRSGREVGWPCPAESGNYQSQMSKQKAMEPMQAATTKAMDKRAAAFCRNEKRRMDRARLFCLSQLLLLALLIEIQACSFSSFKSSLHMDLHLQTSGIK